MWKRGKAQVIDFFVQDGTAVMGGTKEQPVIPTVPFSACVSSFAAEAIISGVESAAAGAKVQGKQTQRFKTFPPYLMVHLQKCAVALARHFGVPGLPLLHPCSFLLCNMTVLDQNCESMSCKTHHLRRTVSAALKALPAL
jgi:hypothetical protein